MKRPSNIPDTAVLNEFGQWAVTWTDGLYDYTDLYTQDGEYCMRIEMEI